MIPKPILDYLNAMVPGATLDVAKAKDPGVFIQACKDYIDEGGQLQFDDDYSCVKKLHPIPNFLSK